VVNFTGTVSGSVDAGFVQVEWIGDSKSNANWSDSESKLKCGQIVLCHIHITCGLEYFWHWCNASSAGFLNLPVWIIDWLYYAILLEVDEAIGRPTPITTWVPGWTVDDLLLREFKELAVIDRVVGLKTGYCHKSVAGATRTLVLNRSHNTVVSPVPANYRVVNFRHNSLCTKTRIVAFSLNSIWWIAGIVNRIDREGTVKDALLGVVRVDDVVLCTTVAFARQSIASIAVLATRQAVRRIRVLTTGACNGIATIGHIARSD